MSEPHDRSHVDPEYVFPEPRVMPRDVLRESLTARHFRTTKRTMEPDPDSPGKMRQTAYCQWCAVHRPDEDPRWPCETAQLLAAVPSESDAGLDRETIARFLHDEMFDATPDNSLDLDATAWDMADRLLARLRVARP